MGRNRRLQAAALLAVVAAGGLVLAAVDPAGRALFPRCPLRALVGLECPGCGSTRALHQLLQGNLRAALSLNPMLVLYLPVLGYVTLSAALVTLGRERLPRVYVRSVWIWLLLATVVAFGIVRNTPLYPG